MRKYLPVVSVTMLFISVLALAAMAMAADPHVGTWKLNVAKSKFAGPAPKSGTPRFEAQENGIKLVSDGVNAEGKATHTEFAAKYDGKDYPLKGSQTIDTVSFKKIDDNTFEQVLKKGGKVVGHAREVFSKDGKTLTRTVHETNAQGQEITNISVYEKQ